MRLRSRRTRALALGAASAVLVGLASLAYLHVQIPLPRALQPGPSPPPQLTATEFDDVAYDFLSPSVGWALDLRNDTVGDSGHFWILKTTDGARHWQTIFQGTFSSAAQGHIVFFDRLHGFAYLDREGPAVVYSTVDGGAHWIRLPVPPVTFGAVTFADAEAGWILADPSGGEGGAATAIYTTTDGGASWFREADPPGFTAGLEMRNRNEGWLGSGGDVPAVLLTTDGGVSWRERRLPSGPGATFACSSSVMLVPGDGVIALASCKSGPSEQVESSDGGLTWTPLPTPPPDNTSWDRTSFIDSQNWWTMTGGALWKSADGGQTWKDYGLQLDDWEYIPHAFDLSHAWAQLVHTGPNPSRLSGLAMTSDGGIHWTQVNAPRP